LPHNEAVDSQQLATDFEASKIASDPSPVVEACSELAEVVQAWPTLNPSLRDAIMSIVRANE
jgi:hypothetical protein